MTPLMEKLLTVMGTGEDNGKVTSVLARRVRDKYIGTAAGPASIGGPLGVLREQGKVGYIEKPFGRPQPTWVEGNWEQLIPLKRHWYKL